MSGEPDGAAVGSDQGARGAAALVALAVLALAAAAAAPWLVRAASPQLAVDVLYDEGPPRNPKAMWDPITFVCGPDPWGQRWRPLPGPNWQWDPRAVYSSGPDGRDDARAGDDVVPTYDALERRSRLAFRLAQRARLLAALVALALAGWALAVGAPRQTGPREGLLVVAVSAPLWLLGTIALDAALVDPAWRDRLPASDLALVAPADGLRATWALVVLLASTGLRFACRPLERTEDPAPGEPDAAWP